MQPGMASDVNERLHRRAPQDHVDRLRKFRSTHPYKQLSVDGVTWTYLSGGNGEETLLLLAGGSGIGEGMAFILAALEDEYSLVSPFYPPVTTMEQLADGIIGILEAENIHSVNVLGQSFGGMLAQVIVHRFPDRVGKLILSHTTTTSPPVNEAVLLERESRVKRAAKVFPLLPLGWRLMRLMYRRRISQHVSVMSTEERQFWKAYLHQVVTRMSKEYVISSFKCMLDFLQNYAFAKDDLAGWPGKVLILQSDSDPHSTASERETIRELYPEARVHTFRGTGHVTLIVNPEEFVSVVRDFLRE